MHRTALLSWSFTGVALLAQAPQTVPAVAETQPPMKVERPTAPITRADLFGSTGVLHDRVGDTEWAAAATWKAGFAPTGATFVPFLGSDAERNWPLGFTTRRVVVAGQELPLQGDAIPSRDGGRVRYQHGPVEARYDLRADGIEQSFCFPSLPSRGELHVEVAVQTDLECQPDGRGFRFVGPRGGVHYGAAVAIDARGRRLELTTVWQDGALQWTVPAEFVQQAELPLVIDPLVGTIAPIYASATAMLWPDVVIEPTTGTHVISFEFEFSQADSDVYLQRTNSTFGSLGALTAVDLSLASWRRPRIAGADIGDQQLVVAEVSTGNVAPFKVVGRHFVDGLSPGAPFDIALNATNPDVGGDSRGMVPVMYLVAYEVLYSATDHDIHARTVTSTGGLGTAQTVDSATTLEREPVVSKNNGTVPGSPTWGIVYRRNVSATTGQVRGACWNGLGLAVVNGAKHWPLSGTNTDALASWSISSVANSPSGRVYLAAWTRNGMTGSGQQSAYPEGMLFDTAGTIVYGPWLLSALASFARYVDVDSDGFRFAATWLEDYSTVNDKLHFDTVAWDGSQVTSPDNAQPINVNAGGITSNRRPVLAGRQAGAFSARHDVVFGRLENGTSYLDALQYDAMSYQYGIPYGWNERTTGCGSLAIARNGEGNLGATLTVSLPAAQGLAGFVAGAPVSLPIGACFSCTQGAHGASFLGPNLSVNVPADLGLLGVTLAFQGWDFVTAGGPCLGQLHLSNTLDVKLR